MRARLLTASLLVGAIVAGAVFAQSKTDKAAAPPGSSTSTATAIATFAGGCFWCTESDFDKVPGVISTTSGYIGGRIANPTYDIVSAGNSGHAEAVQVVFDPSKVSYSKLVEYYWRTIDPTTKDRQFCDSGNPYRTAIFVQDDQQKAIAEASKKALSDNKPFREPIVTEIVTAGHVLPGRGVSPGLLQEEPDPLQVLPHQLWSRCPPEATMGRAGAPAGNQ